MSITDLADHANTSETTVTRFCRSLGLRGFPQLRLLLYAADDRLNALEKQGEGLTGNIEPGDPTGDIVAKTAFAASQAVQDTARQLDVETLEIAIDLVSKANRVDVFASGAAGIVAQDLQGKLHHIGLACFYWPDLHRALISAAQLTDRDVAIAISQTGRTRETIEVLTVAQRHAAATLALTCDPRSPLAQVADYVLTSASTEPGFRSGTTRNRIGQLMVVDCLFTGVGHHRHEKSFDALQRAYEAVSEHTISRTRPIRRPSK